ncbi:MAG: hypothetical protein RJB66_1927 [Pseudomonadota bacterium]|jgi:putative phosphoribosyl transferase
MQLFKNRLEAGKILAQRLGSQTWDNTCVLGLPRGGVPVAIEVSKHLSLPMDVLIVSKIGAPFHPEYAIGAIAEDEKPLWNSEALDTLSIPKETRDNLVEKLREKIRKRILLWRPQPRFEIRGKTIILVDDGLATGLTMKAAIHYLRQHHVASIVVAVPVAPLSSKLDFQNQCDQFIALKWPSSFSAVGEWYEDFSQVEDDTVTELLKSYTPNSPKERSIEIPTSQGDLHGIMRVPHSAQGLILFAHGSGSSHRSPRNHKVAHELNKIGFATLLFDLLTPVEENERSNVFNIELLSDRLRIATDWARQQPDLTHLPIAYFGASTGAAAAIVAASKDKDVFTVVSRGGRPDLAIRYLNDIQCPILLIVGGKDSDVLKLNREAKLQLRNSSIVVIPGAGHLFEEPNALDHVTQQASNWFLKIVRQKNRIIFQNKTPREAQAPATRSQ